MKRKYIALLLSMICALSMTACNKDEAPVETETTTVEPTETETETTTETETLENESSALQQDESIEKFNFKQGTIEGYQAPVEAPSEDEYHGGVDSTGSDIEFEEDEYTGSDEEYTLDENGEEIIPPTDDEFVNTMNDMLKDGLLTQEEYDQIMETHERDKAWEDNNNSWADSVTPDNGGNGGIHVEVPGATGAPGSGDELPTTPFDMTDDGSGAGVTVH